MPSDQINHSVRASAMPDAQADRGRLAEIARNSNFWYKCAFRFRERCGTLIAGSLRRLYWAAQGMRIGKGIVFPKLVVT